MDKLSKNAVVPLYYQLADVLRNRITSGEFNVGQQLPSERDLMSTFTISRNTVRDAIDVLVQEGLVERSHGKGMFVSSPQLKLGLSRMTSFTEDMRERNLRPSSQLIKAEVIYPPEAIAHELQLLEGEKVLYLERLRLADDLPMAINLSYFPFSQYPALLDEESYNGSMYQILEEKYQVHIAHAEQTVKAAVATQQQADWLKIAKGDPILVIAGTAYSSDDVPVEYMHQVYRGDRYVFSINPIRFRKGR